MWGKVGVVALLSLLLTGAVASYEPGRKSSLLLRFEGGMCTGTAVGAKAVLTAAHCFEIGNTGEYRDSGKIILDDQAPTYYSFVANDEYDHVLLRIVAGVGDKRYAKIGELPDAGEKIYMWGNPMGVRHQLRIGHVMGYRRNILGTPLAMMSSFATSPGDSGGGYFNMKGELVAVHFGRTHDTNSAMAVTKMEFSREDWARALAP